MRKKEKFGVCALSLAVFAFAVEVMKERERRMTWARPWASLKLFKKSISDYCNCD